tara:strand:- start:378 stop:1211 length:834 start_codon:yes stop_codon:yes gene_type:complete
MASNNPDQNTLTAPADRDKSHLFDFNKDPLTDSQVESATADLVDKAHISMYPAQERAFADPSIEDQDFCLVSFVPSVNAVPDKDGIYGMVKVRGTYNTLEKCDKRAEFLIREVDSIHKIFIAGVGKPFPITNVSTFSKDINRIKIQDMLSQELKHEQTKQERELEEMREREKEIIERNTKPEEERNEIDPEEMYITNRVKKAQLTWTYINTMQKLKDMQANIINAREEIARLDKSNPELKDSYLERYNAALKKVNLSQENDSFIMYLENDAIDELGF